MNKESEKLLNTLVAAFLCSAAAILFLTGIAKIWSAFGGMKALLAPDPITGVFFGHLMLAAGIVEMMASLLCVFSKSTRLQIFVIAWLATSFVVYRCGLWLAGWHKPCSCLGNLSDGLHISPQTADTAMKIVLAYLLIGSYATLFWLWRQKRKQSSARAIGAASL